MTVGLVRLSVGAFEALAAQDVAAVERELGLTVLDAFAERVEIWHYMLTLVNADPANTDWLMQAVVVDDLVVGNAGFKGAPTNGVVELGYSIAPQHRRQGLASAAVQLLLEEARAHPAVNAVIARIEPENEASIGVITKAGFSQDPDHQHPRWGRQLQFRHTLS